MRGIGGHGTLPRVSRLDRRLWTGSWTEALVQPWAIGALRPDARAIGAARTGGAVSRAHGKEKVYGSIP